MGDTSSTIGVVKNEVKSLTARLEESNAEIEGISRNTGMLSRGLPWLG